jgi:hypothetical protein
MKIALPGLLLLLLSTGAMAETPVRPEVVRFQSVHVDGDVKTVMVGNTNRRFSLSCNIKTDGCITPEPNQNYLLFNSYTYWNLPGEKQSITLAFLQDWIARYNDGENIGLVPEKGGSRDQLGMFLLDRAGRGYDRDTIISDGPIIYGTGLNNEDRTQAWLRFFRVMVQACGQQQGSEALGLKLAKKCQPGQDFCTTAIDADLDGIGGIPERGKVLLTVTTDIRDPDRQLSRTVCTQPTHQARTCRDWDTGKRVVEDKAQ